MSTVASAGGLAARLVAGLLAAAVLAGCGTPQAPVTPGVVKVVAGENFWGDIGILLLGYYQGFATAATNILFGNIFGVSGGQLLTLVAIGLLVVAVMATWYPAAAVRLRRPRGGRGTLLVLSLAITPAAAAQRLSTSPLVIAALSVVFAVAADGGLLAGFAASNVKASVFITSISFAIYLAARLTGPLLRDRRQRRYRSCRT